MSPDNSDLEAVLAEVRAAAAEARALAGEVRAERATVDAYRAELTAWREESKARFDAVDRELQNLAAFLFNHEHPNGAE
jgi:hypothetical protein